jgi:peptidoglycan hydrolase-like protein with peptidoglycan-binding domain
MQYPGRVIREGDQDHAIVTAIQHVLNSAGCGTIAEDGIFASGTKSALRLFQYRRDLRDDGEVGRATWDQLFGTTPSVAYVAPNNFMAEVLRIAISQDGVRETLGSPNRGPEVDEYLRAAGYDPEKGSYSWCMSFVYWCHLQASQTLRLSNPCPHTGGVLDAWAKVPGHTRLAAADAYNNPGLIEPGSIFFVDHGNQKGHCGIVKVSMGPVVLTVEGNTNAAGSREGDGVYQKQRRVKDINLGFVDFSRRQVS